MKAAVKNYLNSSLKTKISLQSLYKEIQTEISEVELFLQSFSRSRNKIISEISSFLFKNGGKRIRPALLLLCSKLQGYKGKNHILFSALIESIHTASLIHDDIIDNSDLRRGRETVHSRWGPNITVLLGDYLYIKTMGIAFQNFSKKILRVLTDVSTEMIEGELDEYYHSGNVELDEEDYLEIIRKKTASLFSASCSIGGMLANSSPEEENRLAEFGLNLGMTFQIIDDLLDYTGDKEVLGKPILTDLSEGRVTLPLIFTLENDGAAYREKITRFLKNKELGESAQAEILQIVKNNGALDYSREKAGEYSLKAKEAILGFPPSIFRDALSLFPEFILSRRK